MSTDTSECFLLCYSITFILFGLHLLFCSVVRWLCPKWWVRVAMLWPYILKQTNGNCCFSSASNDYSLLLQVSWVILEQGFLRYFRIQRKVLLFKEGFIINKHLLHPFRKETMILAHCWRLCYFLSMAVSVCSATKDPEFKNGYLHFYLFSGTPFMPGDGFNSISRSASGIFEIYKLSPIK